MKKLFTAADVRRTRRGLSISAAPIGAWIPFDTFGYAIDFAKFDPNMRFARWPETGVLCRIEVYGDLARARPCMICGQDFRGYGRCCSQLCSDAARKTWFAARTARERIERAEIRGTFICQSCGEGFVPQRTTARFCSGRCRVAAHRQRADP